MIELENHLLLLRRYANLLNLLAFKIMSFFYQSAKIIDYNIIASLDDYF